MSNVIPAHLMRDRYWKALLHLFKNHSKLSQYFTTKYIDPEVERVMVRSLQSASRPWSESEKFMLRLALHLFDESNKLPNGLGDMDYLDEYNTKLAIEAISIRYGL